MFANMLVLFIYPFIFHRRSATVIFLQKIEICRLRE